MRRFFYLVLILAFAACNGGGEGSTSETDTVDMVIPVDTFAVDTFVPIDSVDAAEDTSAAPDTVPADTTPDGPPPLECEPGEGCFLDKCAENAECLSGWCVEHMGEGVCTKTCQEECPPDWTCKPVGGEGPDLQYVCVSRHANLCRPCSTGNDCKSVGGAEDVCVDYDSEGSFCGGLCEADGDCPWGFSCEDALTVDGIETKQCVADAGTCPCTGKSVALSLWTPCVVESEWGACAGKRVCTEEGLSECDAEVPGEELCNGLDDDCDGQADEPVGDPPVSLCDDGNPCTTDTCGGEAGCQHQTLTEGECLDGDACTIGDHCEAGVCVGTPIDCDDENPCTDDSCDGMGGCIFENNVADCDDGDPCTVADECGDGTCAGFPVNCDCQEDADCDDLEDGDVCNGTLFCNTEAIPYQCEIAPDSIVACPAPEDGPDALCQAAACDPETGDCGLAPAHEGLPCDDGDPCTIGDLCEAGACKAGEPAVCVDGNPCTDDACDPDAGCVYTNNTAACNDGDACTTGDTCADGACQGTGALPCDDENPCTDDDCDPLAGCTHAPNQADCDDGNACTVADKCDGGVCSFGLQKLCDDDNPCTDDSCNPDTGCVFALNEAPCDDGDVCTTGDHCHLGGCISSGELVCVDGNPCTDDSCDPDAGCTFTANQADCDDGNDCTVNDVCSGGACAGGQTLVCDDDNECTADYCDDGCVYVNIQGPCDDGDECTVDSVCDGGTCGGGITFTCDDDNECTDDSCDPDTGCVFTNNEKTCDDGDECTDGDACAGGECQSGAPLVCNDNEVCTTDSCDPDIGCVYTPVEEGTSCGEELHCVAGACVPDCQAGSQDFSFTGSVQTFVVPDCVSQVQIEVWGAQGGSSGNKVGGLGGHSVGTLAVYGGQVLYVYVGGRGPDAPNAQVGGWNGGGFGTDHDSTRGGSGGGGTDVRTMGGAWDDSAGLNARVIVGGGGGGGWDYPGYNVANGGHGGGLSGESPANGGGAYPGTQNSSGCCGGAGFGKGGGNHSYGGGGGGWWGGGSADGCCAGPGAGGSGYIGGVTNGTTTTGQNSGHGKAKISW